MSELSYLEKLLDGVEVKWLPLGHIAAIKTGQSVNKNMISKNPGVYPVLTMTQLVLLPGELVSAL